MTTPTSITSPSTRPSALDRLRRELYLVRLELWLEADAPSKDRRDVFTQLRGDLDAAAADSSMREAIAALGPPRHLAAEYRESLRPGPGRPLWATGATVALMWITVCLLASLVFSSALIQAAPAGGPDGVTARLLWAEFTVINTPEQFSGAVTGIQWTLLVAIALLLIGARVWRGIPRRRRLADTAE